MEKIAKIFDFLHVIRNLKNTYRFGAKVTDIKEDSSADHSWRVALMTFIFADELKLDLDLYKAVKIALVHDLAEAIAGDVDQTLILNNIVTKGEKEKNELAAMIKICHELPPALSKDIFACWEDYNNGSSREAKFVKAMDKMETLVHLIEEGGENFDYPDFIATYADSSVSNFPELKSTLKELKARLKKEFAKAEFEWKKEYEKV